MLLRSHRIVALARRRARIEIIPLIDVIFFLLATFVLFTLSLNRIQTVPVDLPFPGDGKDKPEAVTIQVSDAGAIYWNRELIEPSEVPARLTHYKTQTDTPRVVITGDEKAKFGPLVAVLDEVRRSGIATFSVETKPRPTGK
ncbi:MAG TPA: biopolymer transporter ExbD [Lacunisphaera sp.]